VNGDVMSAREVDFKQALCRGTDNPNQFHLDDLDSKWRITKQAKQLCHTPCPILSDCLRYAMVNRIDYGVWGGTTGKERERMRKKKRARQEAAA
jgi:WhiB family transcriptional regulator, redox-sensing transcriptional regulator